MWTCCELHEQGFWFEETGNEKILHVENNQIHKMCNALEHEGAGILSTPGAQLEKKWQPLITGPSRGDRTPPRARLRSGTGTHTPLLLTRHVPDKCVVQKLYSLKG